MTDDGSSETLRIIVEKHVWPYVSFENWNNYVSTSLFSLEAFLIPDSARKGVLILENQNMCIIGSTFYAGNIIANCVRIHQEKGLPYLRTTVSHK